MIFLFKIGFLDVSWVDIIDILFVAVLLYQLYKLLRGSVAVKIFLGFLSLYLIYLMVNAAQMELLSLILGQFMGVGVLAVFILFQQEIRKFLIIVGKSTVFDRENLLKGFMIWKKAEHNFELSLNPIIEAAKTMSAAKTGALVVFSRNSELKFYAESGDILNAEVSKRLLLSIFNKYSPLHDGAAIIFKGRIVAARCILPVSENDTLPANFGLRHRAAIGMSEATDTLILVVSEETGKIAIARNGSIQHNLTTQGIRKTITDYLTESALGREYQELPKEEGDVGELSGKII